MSWAFSRHFKRKEVACKLPVALLSANPKQVYDQILAPLCKQLQLHPVFVSCEDVPYTEVNDKLTSQCGGFNASFQSIPALFFLSGVDYLQDSHVTRLKSTLATGARTSCVVLHVFDLATSDTVLGKWFKAHKIETLRDTKRPTTTNTTFGSFSTYRLASPTAKTLHYNKNINNHKISDNGNPHHTNVHKTPSTAAPHNNPTAEATANHRLENVRRMQEASDQRDNQSIADAVPVLRYNSSLGTQTTTPQQSRDSINNRFAGNPRGTTTNFPCYPSRAESLDYQWYSSCVSTHLRRHTAPFKGKRAFIRTHSTEQLQADLKRHKGY